MAKAKTTEAYQLLADDISDIGDASSENGDT